MKSTFLKVSALALVLVLLCVSLASCGAPASDPDKAVKALEKNGYTVAKLDSSLTLAAITLAGIKDVDCVVTGVKGTDNAISIFYFDSAKKADDALEKIKAYAGDSKDSVKKSGKMVYFGTDDAIKAAK